MKKIFSIILFVLLSKTTAFTAVTCSDIRSEKGNDIAKMDQLGKDAGLPDGGYVNRYHQDVIEWLCQIHSWIDQGYVTASDVEALKNTLGAFSEKRSESGRRFGYSKDKFISMGLCNACADNIAMYYTKQPDSKCSKLAMNALAGDPQAIAELQSYPAFCQWKYDEIIASEKIQQPKNVVKQAGICKENFKSCKDNEELINNYRGMIDVKVACKRAVIDNVRYGSPDWEFFDTFGTYS